MQLKTANMYSFDPDEVMYYIESGECVVVTGPDLLPIDGVPFYTHFLQKLTSDYQVVKFYYEKDGFLVFNDAKKRSMLSFQVNKIKSSLSPDLSTLKKIALLPFPFILSVNPDNFLLEIFKERGYEARSAFSRGGLHGTADLQTPPTVDKPLIYNLFGSFDEVNSLILNYDDIFQFIEASFKTKETIFPDLVQKIVQEAKMFLFVGFELNKWYTQLLLRMLTNESQTKYVVNDSSKIEANTKTFLNTGFKVDFLDPSKEDLLDILIENFTKKENSLRQPRMKEEITKAFEASQLDKVHQLIGENKIKECLDFLTLLAGNNEEDKNIVTLLKSQYSTLLDNEAKGTTTTADLQAGLNTLKNNMLTLSPSIYDKTGTI